MICQHCASWIILMLTCLRSFIVIICLFLLSGNWNSFRLSLKWGQCVCFYFCQLWFTGNHFALDCYTQKYDEKQMPMQLDWCKVKSQCKWMCELTCLNVNTGMWSSILESTSNRFEFRPETDCAVCVSELINGRDGKNIINIPHYLFVKSEIVNYRWKELSCCISSIFPFVSLSALISSLLSVNSLCDI